MFALIEGETMSQQYDRLTKILNELRIKGREYDIDEVLENFLRSLPAQWRMYTISIRSSYELRNLDLVELHGLLKTYELDMSQDNKMMNNKKDAEWELLAHRMWSLSRNKLRRDLQEIITDK
ncbi:hypothetical protein L1987_06505 [Smallanthus sonchifolius]|uniref:Uncharacterized protein n=1 Tax=Smallanthus sonchifolius TaxID=185202 RepID=A0ACB9JYA4_9ASTR|nr:hypothetical protein L1987_06505 [Smallanthus sonchifolius]